MTSLVHPTRTVAIVHGALLEQPGFAERTLAWARDSLRSAGARVDVLVPARDEGPSPAQLHGYDLVLLGDVGGCYGELAWISALAALDTKLVVMSHGFPFCVDGTRFCGVCPLRLSCPASDRVAVYRRLARRATRIVYHSPLHRELSEAFVGAHPDKTHVLGPVALPALESREPDLPRVAFVRTHEPNEWQALSEIACREPGVELVVYGFLPPDFELPANMRVVEPVSHAVRFAELARAAELVCVPSRPLALGEDVAAMIAAGRRVTLNANVGLASYATDLTEAPQLAELVQRSRQELEALLSDAPGSARDASHERRSGSWLEPGRQVLVWAHHLGLGDSVNLLPLIHALEDNVSIGGVRTALPTVHAGLLGRTLESTVLSNDELDLARERARADLVLELTIYRRDAYAEDIQHERWVQLELARQPLLFGSVHENLLSALTRAGLRVEPRRPRLRHPDEAVARAKQRLEAAGVDLARDLLLACHPGAGGAHKRWPADRFAALARRAGKELGAKVLLITGPSEDLLALPFMGAHVLHSQAEPLVDVAALLSHCHGFVGNDSGLMHVACASGCPALALFGPSAQHLWGPSHPDSVVVAAHDTEGKRHPDLDLISEEAAFEGLCSLVRRIATRPLATSEALLSTSPRLEVRAGEGTYEYVTPLGTVRVSPKGRENPVRSLLERLPAQRRALSEADVDAELLDTLLTTGVIVPAWATRAQTQRLIYEHSTDG